MNHLLFVASKQYVKVLHHKDDVVSKHFNILKIGQIDAMGFVW